MPRLGKTIDTVDYTDASTFTLALNSVANTIYGGLDLTGVDTLTSNKNLTFECAGNFTITSNGKSQGGNDLFYARTGATISLGDAFSAGTISFGGAGTFDANDKNISATIYDFDTNSLANLIMGNGTWTSTYG